MIKNFNDIHNSEVDLWVSGRNLPGKTPQKIVAQKNAPGKLPTRKTINRH